MPRYFFHVREGGDLSRDIEGQTLPDPEAARREAVNANREILGERLLHGSALNKRQIETNDETRLGREFETAQEWTFTHGRLRSYSDDVTQSAPVMTSRKPPSR